MLHFRKKNMVLHGDCLDMLERHVRDATVKLIVFSPPYALQRVRNYGGVPTDRYVPWFLERAKQFKRVLTPDGSMIINICPHIENGQVSGYVDDLKAALKEEWFHIATYYWYKTTTFPFGMRTNTRLKNAIEPCYQFALQQKPAFYPQQVMKPAMPASILRASRLKGMDYEERNSNTGSGYNWNMSLVTAAFRPGGDGDGLVYPDNVIVAAPETRNLHKLYGDPRDRSMASAPFPEQLPAFFIRLLTLKGDVICDPFGGSGSSAIVAKKEGRWFVISETEAANIRFIENRLLKG